MLVEGVKEKTLKHRFHLHYYHVMLKSCAGPIGFAYAVSIIIIFFAFTSTKTHFPIGENVNKLVIGRGSCELDDVLSSDHLIGSKNATAIVQRRLKNMQLNFEEILQDNTILWQTLRSDESSNLSVSFHYPNSSTIVPYVKSMIYVNADPKVVQNLFSSSQFQDTQANIDPFYESSEILSKISVNVNLITKVHALQFIIVTCINY